MKRPAHPFTPLLSRWLDGRATPKEARAVAMLLASDPDAAEAVRLLRAAAEVTSAATPREAPDGLVDRVLAAGAWHGGEVAAFRRAARRLAFAAAALLGLGVGGSVWAATRPAPPAALDDPARTYIEDLVFEELGSAAERESGR